MWKCLPTYRFLTVSAMKLCCANYAFIRYNNGILNRATKIKTKGLDCDKVTYFNVLSFKQVYLTSRGNWYYDIESRIKPHVTHMVRILFTVAPILCNKPYIVCVGHLPLLFHYIISPQS